MRGPPVVLTNTLGRPVTNIISERGAVPMTVVNTLGEPVTLVAQGGEPVTLFNENGTLWDYPFSLFANNEQGAWYDPSDFSTLYQDSTGTTPVTAVEQPVGLMLDRSRGLVLGAELAVGAWTLIIGSNLSGLDNNITATAAPDNARVRLPASTVTGRTYEIVFDVTNISAGSLRLFTGSTAIVTYNTTGLRTLKVRSDGTNFDIVAVGVSTTASATISIRELPGNHATQSSAASRPILRARYNLLERTEEFDNVAWTKVNATVTANAAVAPDGTTTADRVTLTGNGGRLQRAVTTTSSAASIFVKYVSGSGLWSIDTNGAAAADTTIFNIQTGTIVSTGANNSGTTITALANGWYRITTVRGATAGTTLYFGLSAGSLSGDVIDIWGAQLLTAADQTATGGAYQRVGAATDYDTSNPVWRPYLAFDGSDDSMSTASVDFSGTDEVTVFAGVTKLSDAASGLVAELSADKNLNAGSFYLAAPEKTGALGDFSTAFRGSSNSSPVYSAVILAPATRVLTAFGDISANSQTIRQNGTAVQNNPSPSMGTGNFGNYPLFIGRRNNTSLPFNGRLYGLTVLGRTATAAELGAMEAWVAGKTGVTL